LTKAIYFDCFSGASGDMILGALLDLGISVATLKSELAKLKVGNFTLAAEKTVKRNISATQLEVRTGHEHVCRNILDIEKIIQESELSPGVKAQATRIFSRLGEAEAKVHGTSLEKVHFHEVGAVDAIVDIVGACIGLELLGVAQVLASPLNLGKGLVHGSHGILPIPAPATAELLQAVPVYSNEAEGELVTPTGAAILSTLCRQFGDFPPMKIQRIGYGAGTRDLPDRPNVLRVFLGELAEPAGQGKLTGPVDSVIVIEANIDDMNPQIFGPLQEKILELGAVDFYTCPVQMKKNRPGTLLSVVAPIELLETLSRVLFEETTTIGVRYYEAGRRVLERQVEQIEIEWGSVSVKLSKLDGKIVNFAPEFDDCQRLAMKEGVPVKWIQARVTQQFMNRHGLPKV